MGGLLVMDAASVRAGLHRIRYRIGKPQLYVRGGLERTVVQVRYAEPISDRE